MYTFVKWVSTLLTLALCCTVIAVIALRVFAGQGTLSHPADAAPYRDILTEQEQQAWANTPVKSGEAIIQMNQRIPVSTKENIAQMRLINPPYSAFVCSVTLTVKGEDSPLYTTERLQPGTVLNSVPLAQLPNQQETQAVALYTFYDVQGGVRGEYPLEVVLVRE